MPWPKADWVRLATRRVAQPRRGAHTKKQSRGKVARSVVGFFRDKEGKTRPITKPTTELNRKRVVQNPRRFQKLKPAAAPNKETEDISQRLEDFLEQLNENQNSLAILNEQKQTAKTLEAVNQTDRLIALKKKEIQRIRRQIKKLH